MTRFQRVLETLEGVRNRSVPVAPQVMGTAAELMGMPVSTYATRGEAMAEALLTAFDRFGYDLVIVGADHSVEAEALGAGLNYPEKDYPQVVKPLAAGDLDRLPMPDPGQAGRMPVLIQACQMVKRRLGQTAPVVAKVVGPMTIAGQLLGLQQLLFLMVDEPDRFDRLLDFTARVGAAFGKALLTAGADGIIIFEPSGSPSILPPKVFEARLLPRLRHLLTDVHQSGATIRWLCFAAPVHTILPACRQLPANLISLDQSNLPPAARELLPETCFAGNIKPVLFLSATPAEITDAALALLKQNAGRFILSSDCELPLDARGQNIAALVQAARDFAG